MRRSSVDMGEPQAVTFSPYPMRGGIVGRIAGELNTGGHPLWPLASAFFMSSRVLQTAVRLGVFTALAEGPSDAPSLARACRASTEGLEALLTACVALGLLERSSSGLYRNSLLVSRMLLPGRPDYYGDVIEGLSAVYEHWVQLERSVRSGRATVPPTHRGRGESLRAYLSYVHRSSQQQAPLLADAVDLSNCRLLLDIGGGLGTYSIELCRRWPRLEAVVLELPAVVPLAREMIAGQGLSRRIAVQAGDYRSQAFGASNDVVLFANVLQHEPLQVRRILLSKALKSLSPGGRVLVHDAMLNAEKSGPLPVALGGLNLLLHSGGGSYSISELEQWLTEAGFLKPRVEMQTESGLALGIAEAPGQSDR